MSAPEMPHGWTFDGCQYGPSAKRESRGQTVDVDANGITVEERVNGYDGYTSNVFVPLPVLRALLATQRLRIVVEAEAKVLDAIAAIPDIQIDMTLDLRDDLSIQETRAWEAERDRRRNR